MDERNSLRKQIDPWVFSPTAILSLAFVLWGVLDHESLGSTTGDALGWMIENFGWLFVLSTVGFLALASSRAQSVRADPARRGRRPARVPHGSWVAMMFSAGMGIGLMFFGVAEPISHLAAPPHGAGEAEHAGGGAACDGVLVLPLGAAPVGDLRDRRARARLLRLPQGHAAT